MASSTLTIPSLLPGVVSLPVRSPTWVLSYSGVNITADVSDMVVDITYVDNVAHVSDELEITVEDRDHRWVGPWFPGLGDALSLQIGYKGEGLLDCGTFQIQEIELKGPPDQVALKCMGAGATLSLHTPRSRTFENQTLEQIAGIIASAQNMALLTAPGVSSVTFMRVTQNQETDWQFLHRISEAHNYDFSIRGQGSAAAKQLVFYQRTSLENQPIVATLTRGVDSIRTFQFKTHTWHQYQSSTISYQDAHTKALIGATSTETNAPTMDGLNIVTRCENPSEAALKSSSALHTANMGGITCELELEGTTLLMAGVNIAISGFGDTFSGNYHIEKSTHKLIRDSGYVTTLEARHL